MRTILFFAFIFCSVITSCKKSVGRPKSKTDYIPINSAITPRDILLGQDIKSRVNIGFYNYIADMTFLNFEVKETVPRQYDIQAKGFYDNIN